MAFIARIFLGSTTGWRNARTVPPPHPNLWFPENLTENLLHLDNGYSIGLKRVQFFPYRVPQFLIERVIELSSIFSMARMSNLQPTRTHTFSLECLIFEIVQVTVADCKGTGANANFQSLSMKCTVCVAEDWVATDVHALVVSATPEVASFSRRAFISAFPLALRVWQGVLVETLSSKKHHAAERLWRETTDFAISELSAANTTWRMSLPARKSRQRANGQLAWCSHSLKLWKQSAKPWKLETARRRKTKHQNRRSKRLCLAGSPRHAWTAIDADYTIRCGACPAHASTSAHGHEKRDLYLILYTVTALVNSISSGILDRLFLIEWIPSNRYTRFSPNIQSRKTVILRINSIKKNGNTMEKLNEENIQWVSSIKKNGQEKQ